MKRCVSLKEQTQLFFKLSLLLKAGLSLSKALKVLVLNPKFSFLSVIDERLHHGQSFSQALKIENSFSPFVLGVIKVGENSGKLDESVDKIAAYLEETAAFRSKLFAILAYPVFVLSFCVLVLVFVFAFLIPSFAGIFSELNLKLPPVTVFVINAGLFFRAYFIFMFLFLVLLIVAFRIFLMRKEAFRLFIEGRVIRLPVYGEIRRKMLLSGIFGTVAFLLRAGVPLLEAIEICAEISESLLAKRICFLLKESLVSGKKMSVYLTEESWIDPEVVEMVRVAEESGQMETILFKVNQIYNVEVEQKIKTFVSFLEPLSTVVVG
ncbi:MAG: type II secretion system F family protein, partial [Candidatus Saganbacteria bacterium]|nr:type II secretion system F family protein [Candidatus Saganbacteria bacterium]